MKFLITRPMAWVLCTYLIFMGIKGYAANEQKEAGHHQHGSHPECPLPQSAMDILKCASENHPRIRAALLDEQVQSEVEKKEAQIPNPSLNLESVAGEMGNVSRKETKISLMQPLELGGARSARIDLAKAHTYRTRAEFEEVRADIMIETVINLYRLYQLKLQAESSERTIQAYQNSINSLKRRAALSPEQRVSLSVFQMALAEAKLRELSITEERRSLSHYFHMATGNSYEEIKGVLPNQYKWPTLAESAEIKSPAKAKALAEQMAAEAQLSQEQASSWPVLAIGPMVQMEEEGNDKANLYGLQLSFPLPLFNVNGGGRKAAQRGVQRSQELLKITERVQSHEREEILHNYEDSLKALNQSPQFNEIDQENRKNQKLAASGLIPASLAIEAQRSNAELIKTLQERELKTLQALWTIYKLDGRILSESL
ncbi:TolC family protein [Bdellovibrio sp. HCB185ZH]|uniref:TolC family protein n=1 Tax=Bdellovibrio sp. HCB185ZH TaxID=3394235 RepID=UPI0039A42326